MRDITRPPWTTYFFSIALVAASRSSHTIKVGAVFVGAHNNVLSTGYNDVPRGFEHRPAFYQRPLKHVLIPHAEMNGIFNAARHGVSLDGSTVYVTLPPCPACMCSLIQCGVVECNYLYDRRSKDQQNEGDQFIQQCLDIIKQQSDIRLIEHQLDQLPGLQMPSSF